MFFNVTKNSQKMSDYKYYPYYLTAFRPDVMNNELQKQDEEEVSCTKMIQGLLLWDRSHTLFNGLNELTKYTELSSLNINQG